MKVHDMPSWMELGVPVDHYDDEPLCTAQQVLDVLFGRSQLDGRGRDSETIFTDTSMVCWTDNFAATPEATDDLFAFLGRQWESVPESVRRLITDLAEAVANEEDGANDYGN